MQHFIYPVNSLIAFAVLSGETCRFRVISYLIKPPELLAAAFF